MQAEHIFSHPRSATIPCGEGSLNGLCQHRAPVTSQVGDREFSGFESVLAG